MNLFSRPSRIQFIFIAGLSTLTLALMNRRGDSVDSASSPIATDPEASCGPVSLAVALRWLALPCELDELNRSARVTASGVTSLVDLERAAKAQGVVAQAVRIDPRRPLPWLLPMILHVNGNHFVAALPMDADTLVVVDLPREPRVRRCKELNSSWNGVALVLARTSDQLGQALSELPK